MPRRRGRRGNGGLTERPNGHWQAAWSRTEGGKRVRETRTFPTKNEAQWWLKEAKRGHVPDDPLVADYLVRWLAGKRRIRQSTHALYDSHIRVHISPALGAFRLSELRPRHVEVFVDSIGLAPGTVGLVLRTLRGALGAAVRNGELADNPAAHVEAPEVRRKPVEAMTVIERDAILAAIEGHWLEYPVRFLAGSGCRIGEACALNQGDVHDGWVSIRSPKGQPRATRVSADAQEALAEAIRTAPRRGKDEPVFFGPHGDRLSRVAATHALPTLLVRAGLPRLTPHAMRHGVASMLVAAGWSMKVVAEQLGNTERVASETYSHLGPDTMRAAVQSLDVKRRQG
jgi:integrase